MKNLLPMAVASFLGLAALHGHAAAGILFNKCGACTTTSVYRVKVTSTQYNAFSPACVDDVRYGRCHKALFGGLCHRHGCGQCNFGYQGGCQGGCEGGCGDGASAPGPMAPGGAAMPQGHASYPGYNYGPAMMPNNSYGQMPYGYGMPNYQTAGYQPAGYMPMQNPGYYPGVAPRQGGMMPGYGPQAGMMPGYGPQAGMMPGYGPPAGMMPGYGQNRGF